MDEQGTAKAKQENKPQGSQSQAEVPSRGQRNQASTNPESQGSLSKQSRGSESYGMERRHQGSPSYFSPFSVTPGEFFTMSPITLMRRFTEDIDRAFGFPGNRSSIASMEQGQELDWVPRVEVRQSENNLMVHAELPGLTEKDIRVETTDQGLLITGEKKRQHENEEEGWHHSEINYGRFSRLIPLPENAKIEEARANFQNGVLEVSIPLPEAENKRRQVPIQTTGTTQGSQQSSGSATKAASAGR
jgi:HSP20 family protein